MGIQSTNEKRIIKIKRILHYHQPISISKIAYMTGLHFYSVEDVLNQLVNSDQIEKINNKFKLKEVKEATK
jgi:hypothetical protein